MINFEKAYVFHFENMGKWRSIDCFVLNQRKFIILLSLRLLVMKDVLFWTISVIKTESISLKRLWNVFIVLLI
jgi:hypothetical protein